jgi:hypothetical protein
MMRCNNLWLGLAVTAMCMASAAGCSQCPSDVAKAPADAAKVAGEHAEHKHDHNAPGKHGGQQQLLGNHEYHAELAHNEATAEVAVYITDAEFTAVAVPEKEMFLTALVGGQSKEFTLAADPHPADNQPRFVLVDKQLCEAVCDGPDGVRLNATLKGKPYAATYTPSAHADHEHEHEKESAHK